MPGKSSNKNAQVKKAPVKKTTSKKAPVTDVSVSEPVPVTEPVADVSVSESVPVPVTEPVTDGPQESSDGFMNYSSSLDTLESRYKEMLKIAKEGLSEIVALRKQFVKDKKVVDKKLKQKTRRNSGEKAMNGFSKPGPVSDELRQFLNMSKEDLIARTEVTKKITEYCQAHKLQNEKDKRIIIPDKTLSKLLRLKKGDELTYFNLQKYMKVHFPNKEGVYPTIS